MPEETKAVQHHWRYFFHDPYRPFFFIGAFLITYFMMTWSLLFAHWLDWSLVPWQHAFSLLLGGFGAYALGFIFTIFPGQMAIKPLKKPLWVLLWVWHSLTYLGLWHAWAFNQVSAIQFFSCMQWLEWLIVWLVLLFWGINKLRQGWDLNALAIPGCFAAVIVALYFSAQAQHSLAAEILVYNFFVVLMVVLSQQEIPFFTSGNIAAYKPGTGHWLIAVFFIGMILRHFSWPSVQLLAGGIMILFLVREMIGWRPRLILSSEKPLLWTLLLPMFWLMVGLGFETIHPFGFEQGDSLGRHTIAIGAITGFIVVLSVRVRRGYSGMSLQFGHRGIWMFVWLQIALLFRVLGIFELAPLHMLKSAAHTIVLVFMIDLFLMGKILFRRNISSG